MATASFTIYFDGPALKAGEMNVRELAPALLALGDMFDRSNQIINRGHATVTVNVKRFPSGSFGVELSVAQTIIEQVKTLFSDVSLTDAANLAQILGFLGIGKGLFWLIKRAKGRRPRRAVRLEDGRIRLEFEGFYEEVEEPVVDLFKDMGVRTAIAEALKPLEREGIDVFKVRYDNKTTETITREEAVYFVAPDIEDEKLQEDVTTRVLAIISLSFKDDRKWRFYDGDSEFWATISDVKFLQMVDQNAAVFCKGDRLKVRIKTIQWDTPKGLRKEYDIVEIIEHNSAARQLKLPIEPSD